MQKPPPGHFKRLLSYLRPYWLTVLAAVLCTFFVSIAKLSQARFIGKIFSLMEGNKLLKGVAPPLVSTPFGEATPLAALNIICLLFLAVMAFMGLSTYVMRYLVNLSGQLAMRDMRNEVFAHVQRLPLPFYDKMRLGEIQSRASGDVVAATAIFTQLADFAVNLMIVVVALSYMIVTEFKMTMTVFALSPIIGIAIAKFGKAIRRLSETIQARGADLSSITYEGISSVKGIKAYSLEQLQVQRFEDKSQESFEVNMHLQRVSASQSPVVDFLGALGIVLIVYLGARNMLQTGTPLGQMAEYWTLLVMTTQPINALSGFYSSVQAASAAGGRVFEILDQPTEDQLSAGLPDLPAVQGLVEFDNVVFGYNEEKLALRGLNLRVEPGEVIAIVGSNGAGKTTLINLLARFYDPQSGTVKIDGHDVSKVNLHSLRSQIGMVTQESILLAGTIAENIAMGRRESTLEEVQAAARTANAHEFIERLPQGYATEIGERGARLSGGQRQRIAIARALLRNPRILVLDEFTSGIDPESEVLITDAIEKSLQGRTCFVIAHRFNTIRHAHRILVLDEGEVVESGTHDQLIANNGLYSRIYHAQLKPKDHGNGVPSLQNTALGAAQ
jgi:ATP-binding cassette, subfamily B, bacterial MsbA